MQCAYYLASLNGIAVKRHIDQKLGRSVRSVRRIPGTDCWQMARMNHAILSRRERLRQNLFDHSTVDIRQPTINSTGANHESLVVDAQ
jgi:hypothetical protein